MTFWTFLLINELIIGGVYVIGVRKINKRDLNRKKTMADWMPSARVQISGYTGNRKEAFKAIRRCSSPTTRSEVKSLLSTGGVLYLYRDIHDIQLDYRNLATGKVEFELLEWDLKNKEEYMKMRKVRRIAHFH